MEPQSVFIWKLSLYTPARPALVANWHVRGCAFWAEDLAEVSSAPCFARWSCLHYTLHRLPECGAERRGQGQNKSHPGDLCIVQFHEAG